MTQSTQLIAVQFGESVQSAVLFSVGRILGQLACRSESSQVKTDLLDFRKFLHVRSVQVKSGQVRSCYVMLGQVRSSVLISVSAHFHRKTNSISQVVLVCQSIIILTQR